MNVQRIMTTGVRTIGIDAGLDAAAGQMWEMDCGCLPVVDAHDRIVGMLTDRDICMHAWTQGRPLRELVVRAAMSAGVVTCRPNDPVSRAERLMQKHQVRRLPVVDAGGHPIGIVSLGDLAREAMSEHESVERAVTDTDVAHTLATVCQPRRIACIALGPVGSA